MILESRKSQSILASLRLLGGVQSRKKSVEISTSGGGGSDRSQFPHFLKSM